MNLLASAIKSELAANGISTRQWAQYFGFSESLVYAVLNGQNKATRGQSFEIAVALGLKRKPELTEVSGFLRPMVIDGARDKFSTEAWRNGSLKQESPMT
jgi:gp16 family phage-associated protein